MIDDDARSPDAWVALFTRPNLAPGVAGALVGAAFGFAVLIWPGLPLPWGFAAIVAFLSGLVWLGWEAKLVAAAPKQPRRDAELTRELADPPPPPPPPPPQRPSLVELVDIPAGTFWMGSPAEDDQASGDDRPRHLVRVSAFRMGKTPITRGMVRKHAKTLRHTGWPEGSDDLPANGVSWFDAVRFCNDLSAAEGLTACYEIGDGDAADVAWRGDADGYRLPTEAEWEYAARAGSAARWVCGNDAATLGEYAWFGGGGGPFAVGGKKPNGWGLHDMAGNVWEWCWDRYGAYDSAEETDPVGSTQGNSRLLRGGAWWNAARLLRSACRNRFEPSHERGIIGFRVVRGPLRQP